MLDEGCPGIGGFAVAEPLCPDVSPPSAFAFADNAVTGTRSGVFPSWVSREDCLAPYADEPSVALLRGLSAFGAGVGMGAAEWNWLTAFAESLWEKRDCVALFPSAFPDETTGEGGVPVEDAPTCALGFTSASLPPLDGGTDVKRLSVPPMRSRSRGFSVSVPKLTRGVTPPVAVAGESGAAGRLAKRVS